MIKPILYASRQSSSSVRTLLTAAHLGSDLELRLVDLTKPADRGALASVNPNGKIPVLVEPGFVLWESHAISEYLCDLSPGQTLLPGQPRPRAEVHRWLYWITAPFGNVTGGLNYERFVKRLTGRGEPDPQAVASHEAGFHQLARVLDAHLADHAYLANEALSVADYSLAAVLLHTETAAYPIGGYAHVLAHRERIRTLPVWQQVFA